MDWAMDRSVQTLLGLLLLHLHLPRLLTNHRLPSSIVAFSGTRRAVDLHIHKSYFLTGDTVPDRDSAEEASIKLRLGQPERPR